MANVDLGDVDDSKHVVLVDEQYDDAGFDIDLKQPGEVALRRVSSEDYNELVEDETYEGRNIEEENDYLLLRSPKAGGYDFAAPAATDAGDALEESFNDFGSALQNAREKVDDTEVLDQLDRYQGRVESFAEDHSSRLEDMEEQRDEVALTGARRISMAADAIREYTEEYGDFQDNVEERVKRLHDEMPDMREPEIWDEIVSDEVQRGVNREVRELLGEDYSPRVGGDEFELEDEEDGDSDDPGFWSRLIGR